MSTQAALNLDPGAEPMAELSDDGRHRYSLWRPVPGGDPARRALPPSSTGRFARPS